MIGWIIIFIFLLFIIYYGYHLTVKKGAGSPEEEGREAACHLCRRKFPIKDLVARDKEAGFVNYFCSECIEALYAELKGKQ